MFAACAFSAFAENLRGCLACAMDPANEYTARVGCPHMQQWYQACAQARGSCSIMRGGGHREAMNPDDATGTIAQAEALKEKFLLFPCATNFCAYVASVSLSIGSFVGVHLNAPRGSKCRRLSLTELKASLLATLRCTTMFAAEGTVSAANGGRDTRTRKTVYTCKRTYTVSPPPPRTSPLREIRMAAGQCHFGSIDFPRCCWPKLLGSP